MKLIFLYGLPAAGKLTVAKELATLTGYRLFHNHLTVDLLLSVFPFGSPGFVEIREKIWLDVFDGACRANLPALIFTFNPENSVRPSFLTQTSEIITSYGGEVLFVEITCDDQELERRMDTPQRREFQKMTSLEDFRRLRAAGVFSSPKMPTPHLSVDTGRLSPKDAAALIARQLSL